VSAAQQLLVAAISALWLAAAAGLPATAAADRSVRVSAHASQRHHAPAPHHASCTHTARRPHPSASRGRACVRGAHSSHPRTRIGARRRQPTAQPSGASRAAAIAAVLATPCENTEVTPEAGNIEAVRGAVMCLIDHVRAQHGEEPLSANAELEHAAQEHGEELVARDYFAHVSPSGETPVDRIRLTGYIPGPSFGYVIGENLAWGTLSLSTPQAIVSAWVSSPGHLANILEGQYQDTGIGIVPAVPPSLGGGQQGATYSQEFGVILG
jgi:uncharacterized protein YkwD